MISVFLFFALSLSIASIVLFDLFILVPDLDIAGIEPAEGFVMDVADQLEVVFLGDAERSRKLVDPEKLRSGLWVQDIGESEIGKIL